MKMTAAVDDCVLGDEVGQKGTVVAQGFEVQVIVDTQGECGADGCGDQGERCEAAQLRGGARRAR